MGDTRADVPGIYLWVVPVRNRSLPYYVGESGKSIAFRHYDHFREYASGKYTVRDGRKLAAGEIDEVNKGVFWAKDGWRNTQKFIDNFAEYAQHLEVYLDSIKIYLAPLDADRRTRRVIEGTLIRHIYSLAGAVAAVGQIRCFSGCEVEQADSWTHPHVPE
jgi:hypothetical protein